MLYRWPGNVRELQNSIERAVILSGNGRQITAAALGLSASGGFQTELPLMVPLEEPPEPVARPEGEGEVPMLGEGGTLSIAELEKRAIGIALKQTNGNRTLAAAKLGISIRTLRNKLQEYRDSGEVPECVNE